MNASKKYFRISAAFIVMLATEGCTLNKTNSLKRQLSSSAETETPLIDRAVFFDESDISSPKLSPDGTQVAFLRAHNGAVNIWLKDSTRPSEPAAALTQFSDPVGSFFWMPNSTTLVFTKDNKGNEDFHIFSVNTGHSKTSPQTAPTPVDLTPGENVHAEILHIPNKNNHTIFVGLNSRDPKAQDVWMLSLISKPPELIFENSGGFSGWLFDRSNKLRLGVRQSKEGINEIVLLNKENHKTLFSCSSLETCNPIAFHENGKQFYLVSNAGDADLTRLLLVDIQSQTSTVLDQDPNQKVDIAEIGFSDQTGELLTCSYEGAKKTIVAKTAAIAEDLAFLSTHFHSSQFAITSRDRTSSVQLVTVTTDTNPGSTYLYKREQKQIDLLFNHKHRIPQDQLSAMKPVNFSARDGVELSGYLTTPRFADSEQKLPAVLFVHGGPWTRDTWNYNSWVQFLANRGYLVLQVNYRGSEGFGKKFLNLGNRQWGRGTMQDDLLDAVDYLIHQTQVDQSRIAIMGMSYGGYATLAGLAFTPKVFAAGVDIVGPSNLITLLNSIPPYWTELKKMLNLRIGDVTNADDFKRLNEQSPLNSAQNIMAPLLVIQGANDPRVKKSESDQIVRSLHTAKKKVEYLVAADEGHGFSKPENKIAMMAAIEKFLATHLGGRSQTETPPELEALLRSLKVDPATLTE